MTAYQALRVGISWGFAFGFAVGALFAVLVFA